MAQIPESVIDEIRQRADIVEVISSYLSLKRSGSNYRALCPFHQEKSPSFNVNQPKQIFHCFGCGEGGNVFSFLMKYENLSFPEAVRALGERYGVAIPEAGRGERAREEKNERYYDAMEAAAQFYHDLLVRQEADSPASAYLSERGITPELVKTFRLGWAPDSWEALYRYLTNEKKIDKETLETAGLIKEGQKGPIDRFRSRLLFPITSPGGRVIAFGGRIVGGDDRAVKYLNSPETPIYHKSSVLYGYHEALASARKSRSFIIAEGYMDVLALRKAGIETAVAVAGVALTEKHADLLRRAADKVTLMFDSDQAGRTAVRRSGPVLLARGIDVAVTTLPGAKDPDEYIQNQGAGSLQALIDKAPSYPRHIIDEILAAHDIGSVEGQVTAAREALQALAAVKDDVERNQYVNYLSGKIGADAEVIAKEASALAREGRKKAANETAPLARRPGKKKSGSERAERVLLGVLLAHPEYLSTVAAELVLDDFSTEANRAIFSLIMKGKEAGLHGASAIVDMAGDDQVRTELMALALEKGLFDETSAETAARDCLTRLKFDPRAQRQARAKVVEAAKEKDGQAFAEAQKKYLESRKKSG